jgi:hypothetical protein
MTAEEYRDAIMALDAWFESQGIQDADAAIVMAQLEAHHLARNFTTDSARHMATAFKGLFDTAMSKYLKEGDDEEKRLN